MYQKAVELARANGWFLAHQSRPMPTLTYMSTLRRARSSLVR